MRQLDVKTAFLHGELEEEIYMELPPGMPGKTGGVVQLHKGLYGLKQANRYWNKKLDATMLKHHYTRISVDHCVYRQVTDMGESITAIHVDDMLAAASNVGEMNRLVSDLREVFDIMDLGDVCWLLGISITRNRPAQTVSLSQKAYIEMITRRFNLEDSHAVWTPMEHKLPLSHDQSPQSIEKVEEMASVPYRGAIGSAMYASLCTRPDISFAVHRLVQYSVAPGMAHWLVIQQVILYLWTTWDYELTLGGGALLP